MRLNHIFPHDTDAYAEVTGIDGTGIKVFLMIVEPLFDADGKLKNYHVFKTTPEFITQSRSS